MRRGSWRELRTPTSNDGGTGAATTLRAVGAEDGSTRTGSQRKNHPDLLLGSWFRFTAGGSAAPGGHGSGWGHVALMRLTGARGRSAEGLLCPFGVDCERARLLAGAAPSYRIDEGGFSAAGRYGLDVSLSEVHPYVRVTLTRRLSVWWTYRSSRQVSPIHGCGRESAGMGCAVAGHPWPAPFGCPVQDDRIRSRRIRERGQGARRTVQVRLRAWRTFALPLPTSSRPRFANR